MGIHSNRSGNQQRRATTQPRNKCKRSINITGNGDDRSVSRCSGTNDEFIRLPRSRRDGILHYNNSWRGISVYPKLFWTRNDKSDNHNARNSNKKFTIYNKRLLKLAKKLCLISVLSVTATPAYAESVGGVSATANPIANSTGSVTNQAIQVLQGPYITNTYGNQISCQGPTFNATPYIQYSNSWSDPFERQYMQPQYNATDFTGRTTTQMVSVRNYPWYDGIARGPTNADGTMGPILYEADGTTPLTIEQNWYNNAVRTNPDGSVMMDDNGTALDDSDDFPVRYYEDGAQMQIEMEVDGPDGIPDNPGEVVWEKPVRNDMKANNNFNIGLSATFSLPLDKKLQKLCKEAAQTQINQQLQITANKRLDFEIARLKNCGELMKAGIMFHPRSPYASICADVVVTTPPGTLTPHSHTLARPTFQEDQTVEQEATGSAEDIGSIGIKNTMIETSSPSPSSPSQSSDAASQSLSPTSPSSPDTYSSEVQIESGGKVTSQASSGWFRWPFSRQASPPVEEDQPAALLGGPIQLPPSQSLP